VAGQAGQERRAQEVRVTHQAQVQVKEVTAALIIQAAQHTALAVVAGQAQLVQMELLAAVVMAAQEQQIAYLDQALLMQAVVAAVVKVDRLAQAAQAVAVQGQGMIQTLQREPQTLVVEAAVAAMVAREERSGA
jgi:hypothetical protein